MVDLAAIVLTASFDTALTSMASYLGNVIMPAVAGITLCMGIYNLAHRAKSGEHYLTATMACLLVSGFIRMIEHFTQVQTDQDQFYMAILSMANWTGNVILPMYAAINFVRATLSISSSSFELTSMGGNTGRHVVVGIACLGASMGLRLLEWFVAQGAGGIH